MTRSGLITCKKNRPFIPEHITIAIPFGFIWIDKPDICYWHKDISDWLWNKFAWYRWVYKRIKAWLQRRKIERSKPLAFKSYDFISFFDEAAGEMVYGRDQLKQRDAEGKVMMTHNEAQRYFRKARLRNEREAKEARKKRVRRTLTEVFKGARNVDITKIPGALPE